MPEDIFGLPTTPIEENPDFSWLSDEDPAPTELTDEQPEEQPSTEDELLAPPAPEEAPAEEPQEEQEVQEEAEEIRRWAGKYTSPEELEKGYRELREMHRRASERANAYEQQNQEILNRARELEYTLQRVMPFVQQAQAQRQTVQTQPRYDEFGNPVAPPPQPQLTPEQMQAYIDRQVTARTQQMQGELYSKAVAAAEKKAALDAIYNFYEKHNIEENDDTDTAIVETVQALNGAWRDGDLDLANADSLEIALEATQRPALLEVLKMNPSYIDTDAGMELARFQASLLEGKAITQQTSAIPASQVGQTTKQRKPVVEGASGTDTAGAANPDGDPWLEAVAEHRERNPFKGSVFE